MENKVVMNGADALPPTLNQLREEGRALSAFYFPQVHPSIIAATITVEQAEKLRRKRRGGGRPQESKIDKASERWSKGYRDIEDYADLLPPNVNNTRRKLKFRSLQSSIRKRLNAEALAEEAKNLALQKEGLSSTATTA